MNVTQGRGTFLGPGLAPGMSEAAVFERLNAWGVARDGELVDLRSSLANTQAVVNATFAEARGTVLQICLLYPSDAAHDLPWVDT